MGIEMAMTGIVYYKEEGAYADVSLLVRTWFLALGGAHERSYVEGRGKTSDRA